MLGDQLFYPELGIVAKLTGRSRHLNNHSYTP